MRTPHFETADRSKFKKTRVTIIATLMVLLTACSSQPTEYLQAQRDMVMQGCPTGAVRACEIIGGNKFRKRYGRCACIAQNF